MSDIDIPLRERRLDELFRLDGRIAVITGAGQGIGLAIAMRLAEAGAAVVITDISAASAERAAVAVAERHRVEALPFVMDVRDEAAVHKGAALAVSRLGGLDIWVNNAGIYPTTGPAIDVEDDFIDRMMAVNVRGTYAGAREAAKRMSGGGVIVNLASTAGFRGARGISVYVASKHAVVGITKNLAIEFGPRDIRVVAVAPGPIDTPGVRDQLAPLKAAGLDVGARMSQTLLGRAGQADDIARVILFLASDLAAWITGDVVAVDAGSLAG